MRQSPCLFWFAFGLGVQMFDGICAREKVCALIDP
jgi:hypothetical protein